MNSEALQYGQGDTSYRAAGELDGITRLVNAFYDYMETLPEARKILAMHRPDLTESRTKLAYFLSGWLGGPRLYAEHFGSINIPMVHRHLPVGEEDRDAWMLCMKKAVADQPFDESFKVYLIEQLWVPAERIRSVCSAPVSR
ncbi:Group 2 truncated hemoglobin YjbI [Marinobacter litoralis]|uniref:Group 2 truncated hemoglobin YjbI n=1 Tax=Marinobacter litoralis TaxID=187981 RepID=A0A3M2RH46_9GAMM|nr:group II truncated hemoglobin [Marinobacter litoralis]RMJ04631.1 Group 2 truncated hemoglobin YjbI [Marinobacter litoralis]